METHEDIDSQTASDMLAMLTEKQVEVLDLLVLHRTTKEIARALDIAPNTVDQRIGAVRDKWGTADRKETARLYGALIDICGKSPWGLSRLHMPDDPDELLEHDVSAEPVFTLSDAHPGQFAGDWNRLTGLEALDARFGRLGRIAAIPLLALVLVLTLVSTLAVANALNELM